MSNPFVTIGEDGKPKFIGKEDPSNKPFPPDLKPIGNMECPVCHGLFPYLVGEDTDGGRMGCEDCWRPPRQQTRKEGGENVEEVIS